MGLFDSIGSGLSSLMSAGADLAMGNIPGAVGQLAQFAQGAMNGGNSPQSVEQQLSSAFSQLPTSQLQQMMQSLDSGSQDPMGLGGGPGAGMPGMGGGMPEMNGMPGMGGGTSGMPGMEGHHRHQHAQDTQGRDVMRNAIEQVLQNRSASMQPM